MIKIELQFETGAEARKALEELLGGSLTISIKKPEIAIKDEKIAENFEAPKMEVVKDEKPVEKKRRTKAEIEAEKNASAPETKEDNYIHRPEGETNDGPFEPSKPAVTKEMLQEKAVNLIRNQKKEAVVAVLKKFGADSIAQADKNPLKVEDYPAVMDELNKIA